MDWTQAVDIYCERTAVGLFNEPFNALSNLGFVAAALWGAVAARQRGLTQPVLWLLIALAAAIGVGSGLFHTFANRWSELADTAPIWTFVAIYVLAAMRWLGGMRPGRIGVIVALVGAGLVLVFLANGEGSDAAIAATAPDPLNGSGQYAPALAALLAFSLITWWRGHPYRHWVWGATLAFLISLGARTVDMRVCTGFPVGTHFLWHLMNAAMIAALLQMLLRVIDDDERAS